MRAMECRRGGCASPHHAKGYCKSHYSQALNSGELVANRRTFRGSTADRLKFYSRTDGSCVVWTGSKTRDGYGKIRYQGSHRNAHRVAYELANGPIPSGFVIDHTCHNPACISIEHLRLATTKQNAENLSGATARSGTGVRGVSWVPSRKKYRAAVKHEGRTHFLGHFATLEEAAEVARQKRVELFTHNDADRHPHASEVEA